MAKRHEWPVMYDVLLRMFRTPERLLHSLRRRKTLEVLRGRACPDSVLVVCHGNICRSPFAAALLRQALRPLVRVESAGFVRPNRAVPPEAIAAAGRRGVDLADHRSRLLTPDLARAADLIVVMDPVQQRHVRERFGRAVRDLIVLGDLDPAPPEGGRVRTIPDPIGQGSAVFETSYARIARCIAGLVSVFVGQAR